MFIQVFQAPLSDADLWSRQVDTWRREIRPKTTGFLGFTSGVTAEGYMITLARFKSAAAAAVDNDLPEQGSWFEATSKAFETEVSFHDCPEVDSLLDGGSDRSGFVQVIQGRAKNQEEMRLRLRSLEPVLRKARPDLIGAVVAWHGDGGFTQAAYFVSETEARKNEQVMAGSDLDGQLATLIDGDPTFYDLRDPDFE